MKKKIIVIDDDHIITGFIQNYLEKHEYDIEIFNNAHEAIDSFEVGKYSLLIVDLVMPEMGGIELLEKLITVDPDLKAVIMTGFPTVDSAYKAMVDGVFEYLIKPFRMKELLTIIKNLVG